MLQPNDHILDVADDYFHGLLLPAAARSVDEHAERCPICKVALDEARKRFGLLDAVAPSEAAEELIQMTLEKIDAEERGRGKFRRYFGPAVFAAIAAVVLVVAGVHLYYLNLTPSPYDLSVFGQTELLAGTVGSIRVRLMNRLTGAPVPDAPVRVQLHGPGTASPTWDHTLLASFTTNDEGTGAPRFNLPDLPDGDYELRVIARPGRGEESITQHIRLKRSWKLMLTSDKPVYQPGQEIHVRSLALRRPDLKPVAGQEVVFTITDPKGNVIFKRRDVTSKFGLASIDCPLATEIIEGPYQIACKIGDTESKLTVEVQKYVLPKFKIDVALDQPYYRPGQTVRGTVQVDYFFGKPVADGEVEIVVRRRDVEEIIQRVTAHTDAAGKATFTYRVPDALVGREQDSGDAGLRFQLQVTDTAGQKQAKTVSRVVTISPLRVEIIPEAGTLAPGVSNTIYLFVSYADGRPAAKARLLVSGQEQELTTNDLGVASYHLTPDVDGVDVTVRATDADGQTGRRTVRLAAGRVSDAFLVRTDKAVYNGGETVKLTALGGGIEPVFVDFIKDGQTLLTESVPLANGRGEYQFDLPPDLFGTVELCAYRFVQPASLPVRKTRVLFIRQAKQLSITAAMDHKEYRPGGQAKLQLTLTDDQGKPTPGALSLAAVDEAVYAVLDQMPGMERIFYTLELQLLKPVYAIYPWSPDLLSSTPADRQEFEQALFSRTSRTADPVDHRSPVRPRRATPDAAPSPHSLFAFSFPEKERQVLASRRTGLERMKTIWYGFGITLAFLGFVTFTMLVRSSTWWLNVREEWAVRRMEGRSRRPSGPAIFICGAITVLVIIAAIGSIGTTAKNTFTLVSGTLRTGMPGRDIRETPEAPRVGAPPPPQMPMSKDAPPMQAAKPETTVAATPEIMLAATEAGTLVRVREWFPETLLWRPEVITDDKGQAKIDVDLADSITTWRLTASAVSADGRLGALHSPIRVFQPFFVDLNLPVALTRGDEIGLPVVVYNYLEKPQIVELSLDDAAWFERLGEAGQRLELAAGEVRSLSYRLRVRQVGNHHLQVTARGSGVADAIKRAIEVVPDGRRVEQVTNGALQQPLSLTLTVPPEAIDGSPKAFVKIYPSTFSQLVEGLDNIFRMPSGCFEQTSSTTYPNVLALDYLQRTKKSVPEVEAKAKQYIHLGYQRLLGFEVRGGGFDWFGRPPANVTLTAYGLMEFQDMAAVHDVDPQLLARTRHWLLSQRRPDGSWMESRKMLNDGLAGSIGRGEWELSTTAYIAWAVFGGNSKDAALTHDYLLTHQPETITSTHTLALVCNALLALDPTGQTAQPYLQRLDSLKQRSDDGKLAWWELPANGVTTFRGGGLCGNVETTALVALAFLKANHQPATARAALSWLTQQKDAHGTWRSTQATVLALKALLVGAGKPLGGEQERRLTLTLDDNVKREIVIPVDQTEVMQQIDLSAHLQPGVHRLTLTEHSGTGAGYQVAFRYHVPEVKRDVKPEPLAIDLRYDRSELTVGDLASATATVTNQMNQVAPMIILDLPIPAGFAVEAEDFTKLVQANTIAKFQLTPRSVIVYLRQLEPGKPLKLTYRLRTTMPVKVAVPAARVYEYYNTDRQGVGATTRMTVTAR